MKRIVKFKKLKRLAAHLEEAHGTPVRRGTPVEKYCPKVLGSNLAPYNFWLMNRRF